jgi:hypothetical protein
MIYTLSRATGKELARGSIMQIAIPSIDDTEDAFYADAVRESIQIPEWAKIIDQRCEVIEVIPSPKIDDSNGLVRYLGQICTGREGSDNLRLRVEVAIITIRDGRRKSWGSTYPPKWPASVAFDDGRVLP